MAKKTITTLTDDITGKEADYSVRFSIDSDQYEIDLSEDNYAALHSALAPFIKSARKIGGRKNSRAGSTAGETSAIREWAKSQGIKVSERGRIASEVVEKYRSR